MFRKYDIQKIFLLCIIVQLLSLLYSGYFGVLLNLSRKTSIDVSRQTRKFYAHANILLHNIWNCGRNIKCKLFAWWLHASKNPSSIICVVSGHLCTFIFIQIYFLALLIILCQIKHYHTIPLLNHYAYNKSFLYQYVLVLTLVQLIIFQC